MQHRVIWLSREPSIPARWDLRLVGWEMVAPPVNYVMLHLFDGRTGCRVGEWHSIEPKRMTIAVGVTCPEERSAMLSAGFADALPMEVAVGELAVRFERIFAAQDHLPRTRRAGPLELDLFHRDARVCGRWLALHPREFALLWRLAETPGERVSSGVLMEDVWRLQHVPETNSLQVHVSRLRAKLAIARLAWLVETAPEGGYRLAVADERREHWTQNAPAHRNARN